VIAGIVNSTPFSMGLAKSTQPLRVAEK